MIDYQAMTEEPGFKALLDWHSRYAAKEDVTPKDQEDLDENSIDFKRISKYLNGFARVVYYQKVMAPKKNIFVTSVMEGRMKCGYFDGFARQMEALGGGGADESNSDKTAAVSSCKMGFWNTIRIFSSEQTGKG